MKKFFFVVFTVFTLTSFSQTGEKNFIDQHYIEVTGKAELEIVPNEIYLKIIVDEKDFKGKQNLQEIERSMTEKLSGIGIDISKQLSIKDMASNFQKYWLKGSEINSVKEYQLVVGNAKRAGQVIQALESQGVSNISIERIEHSEIQKYKAEVKINAIKAAREKAVSLTNAIGQNIGKAIYIRELANPPYAFQGKVAGLANIVVRGYGASDKLKDPEPDIDFEKIKLEYSILVRFEIN